MGRLSDADAAFNAGPMIEFYPVLLLTRAWVHVSMGDAVAAISDLNGAWAMAARSDLRLHLADVHLSRARLFHRVDPYPWAERGRQAADDFEDAQEIVEECAYWRRREELAEIDAALDRHAWRSRTSARSGRISK
jgi:hypothetical protein